MNKATLIEWLEDSIRFYHRQVQALSTQQYKDQAKAQINVLEDCLFRVRQLREESQEK